jgi:hypothetical protein
MMKKWFVEGWCGVGCAGLYGIGFWTAFAGLVLLVEWGARCWMPLMSLDFRETTFVFDYADKTVELYTTSRTVFLHAIARNCNVIEAVDLKPGYRILYAMDQVREPEALLRKRPATASVMNKYLTEKELQRRKNQREIFNERMGITSNQ